MSNAKFWQLVTIYIYQRTRWPISRLTSEIKCVARDMAYLQWRSLESHCSVSWLQWRHMSVMASQIIATGFHVKKLVHADKNENIKRHITGLLYGESADQQWIPSQKASNAESLSMSCIIMQREHLNGIIRVEGQQANSYVTWSVIRIDWHALVQGEISYILAVRVWHQNGSHHVKK